MWRSTLVIVVVAAACRTSSTPSAKPAGTPGRPPSVDGASPALRLPGELVPTAYRASLSIDPGQPTFRGEIEIDATLSVATDQLWLHGAGLAIEEAWAGQVALTADLADDIVSLRAARELPAGAHTLRLVYTGTIDRTETYGAFVQESGGQPYVLTQMQPLGARRVFPCVDEPWSKVPWQLTIDAPGDQVVIANTRVEREEPSGDRKKVVFAASKPIPSYLVAFAVGRFELVDAGTTRGGAPIRIAAFQGRTGDAAWAAEVTPKIVEVLEDWFGTPYPYDKLDSVPMPAPQGFGAMENAGLVTYKESRLLFDPDDDAEDPRRGYVRTAAHELAHQWFGNLVTPAWWDDLWLSEAFATWMEEKVMAIFSPAWGLRIPAVVDRSAALDADGLVTARTLRQPIGGVDDIETAFDDITYQKGAAVIRMFEAWLGADVFQAGVQRFLGDHAWGTATADDFLAALDDASPLDVADALRGYLDQPGAPEVTATLRCDKKAPPVVELTQARWLPVGATAPAGASPRWQIPVCVAYGTVKTREVACTVLADERAELTLDGKCPRWFFPNADGRGYYRMGLDAEALDDLLDDGWKQLRPHERVLVAGDVRAAVRRGGLPVGAELDLVSRLLRDGSRHAIEVSVAIARDALLAASDASRPKVVKWIQKTFATRARKLGFLPDEGDGLDQELARDALVPLAAEIGRESKLLSRAVELSGKWRTLPGPSRRNVLRAAVVKSDDVLAEVREAAAAATDGAEVELLFDAMSASDDPEEAKASLALLLDGQAPLDAAVALLHGLAEHPPTRAVADAFLREHADALLPRMSEVTALDLAGVMTASCDAATRDDAAAWLKARLAPLTGGTRVVAQAVEELDNCIARKALLGPQLDAWLEKR